MKTLIQIGTNNGNDHVRDLCLKNIFNKIILVEPFEIHNKSIKENYKDIGNYIIENVAITNDSDKTKKLYYSEMDGPSRDAVCSYQVSSIIPSHVLKHYDKSVVLETEVNAITINEVFLKHNLSEIEYVFLDAEGIDFEILKDIDFKTFNIKHIQIEHLHINKEELNAFMVSKGYINTNTTLDYHGYDVMFKKS